MSRGRGDALDIDRWMARRWGGEGGLLRFVAHFCAAQATGGLTI